MNDVFKAPLPRKLTTNSFLWFVVDNDGVIYRHSSQQNFDEKEATKILEDLKEDEEFPFDDIKVVAFSLKPEVG